MATTPSPAAANGKRKLTLIAAAGLALLGGGAAAAYVGGLLGGADRVGEHEGLPMAASPVDAHGAAPAVPPSISFVDLPDIMVNLQAPGSRMRFLRVRLAIEVRDEASAQNVKSLIPRLLDSYQLYLRALTPDDVAGPGGMQRLKEDLIARSNIAVTPTKVADVLFKEMLVQ